ncbi:unnamed protein product, partial [Vicia faba]
GCTVESRCWFRDWNKGPTVRSKRVFLHLAKDFQKRMGQGIRFRSKNISSPNFTSVQYIDFISNLLLLNYYIKLKERKQIKWKGDKTCAFWCVLGLTIVAIQLHVNKPSFPSLLSQLVAASSSTSPHRRSERSINHIHLHRQLQNHLLRLRQIHLQCRGFILLRSCFKTNLSVVIVITFSLLFIPPKTTP